MKRFYKLVSVAEARGGFSILLDGKPVKAPSKKLLLAPTKDMAEAIMQEWGAQVDHIIPDTMPLTQILTTRIDRVATERGVMTGALLKYIDTDLLCYRADYPPELAEKQAEAWDRWLAWFAEKSGTKLATTTGLAALAQPQQAHKAARDFVAGLDDDRFTVFQMVASLAGSIILGLAFAEGKISPGEVFAAARVEENYKAGLYNEQKYGPDPAQEKKDRAMLADLEAAATYLKLL